MKKNNKTPKLRFSGYTDDWEQRKLGELALFNPKDEPPQTFEYVDLESVVGTEMLSHRTEAKSSAPSRAQRLAHTGDLFYQTVRPYQRNNYLFEKPDNNYVFSTGYAQMRPYVNGYFLLSLVQSDRFVKVVLDNCTGTSYPAINANDLAEIEVTAPLDENEAQKIGTIFRSIDNLITLHQRKLEKLQNMKKSCLQKMFPKDGATVPEIRFSEFQGDWEERTLGSCFDERLESLPDGELLAVTIGSGIKKFSELDRHDNSNTDKSKYKRVCIGDIAYNSMRMWQGASGRSPYEGIVSPAYTVVKPIGDIDTQFFAYMFKKKEIIHLFEINSQGLTSDTWNLKYPAFSKIVVRVPRNVEEQSRIARFLLELDELISCTEQEIEITKRMKKGCLQKMFV